MRGKAAPVVGERAIRFADAHAYGASVDHPHAEDGVADRVDNAFVARCRNVLLVDEFAFGGVSEEVVVFGLDEDIVVGRVDFYAVAFTSEEGLRTQLRMPPRCPA